MIHPLSAVASMFRPKPAKPLPHVEIRYVASTKSEDKAARQRRADLRLELEIMAIHLTPEARAAAKLRATQRLMRAVGREG